ncbi:MEDS domain-containing protein [Haloterrigena sp. SYSU A558-1]|uniref:MEDS domain-containing protein n=1 Tax=Haloterrigena gelatinilytica TaxID=2741724 RepID=A0ABX2LDS6_9EURY|nr:MEDS domain-containing protein [Haloterrigena gelatinilytica]NUC71991.1 MEDS domain-containing protein [Haloterrigena gelatinilytica]
MDHRTRAARASRLGALSSRPEFQGPVEPLGEHASTEHLSLIYESREQQFAAVIPFLEQGLERGERCLYIASENERTDVVDELDAAGLDAADAIDRGQLVVRSLEEIYLPDGTFDPDETLAFFADALEKGVSDHDALRVTAEMNWIGRSDTAVDDVMEYETRVNDLLHGQEAITLCQYDHDRFSDAVIRDVLETHPHVIYEETISRNVFYSASPAEVSERDRDQRPDTDRLLEGLVEATEAKRALREQVRFLRDLNTITAGSDESDESFEERLQLLFDLGCDQFDRDLGVVAHADRETGRFEIDRTNGDHEYFEPGAELPLSETYCETAIDSGTVADDLLDENGSEDVTVLTEFGLQAPIGTYVEVDGDRNRILFFVNSQFRERPVSREEKRFHALLGRWLKVRLEQRRQITTLERENQYKDFVSDLLGAVIAEPTRSRIEQTVCDRVAGSAFYDAAWISNRPVTDQRPTPTVWAGISDETIRLATDTDPGQTASIRPEFPSRAVDTGQPAACQFGDDASVVDRFHRQLRDRGLDSALAVPLEYEDTCYGVLVAYADGSAAVTDRHQTMLAEAGRRIGFVIAATERKEALVTDEVVELEVRVRDPEHFFFAVTADIDVTFALEQVITQSDGDYLVYVTAIGVPPEAVVERAERSPNIDHVRVVEEREGDALVEFVFAGPTVAETFAEYGATVTAARIADGTGTVTVELPQTADVRAAVDAFQTTFPDSEVVTKRHRDRPLTTERGFRHAVADQLTEKQREVLQAAYFAGYFEHPRRSTGNEIADTLDISSSTFHQHLQVGLRKLLTAAFDDGNDG